MKHFSFKIIILCLIAPPVLYLISMHYFERYLDAKYRTEIEEVYIGDTAPLFDGSITLKRAVNNNIDDYIIKDFLISSGIAVTVTVTTRQGMMLYPDTFDEKNADFFAGNPDEAAAENYALLNEGLYLRVDANLNQNTLPANIFLLFLIFSAALFLYLHYRSGARKARADFDETEKEIERLHSMEQAYATQMDSIARERETLSARFSETKKKLEAEREKSERSEEDLIEEIVSLEKDLGDNLAEQEQQQKRIDDLKEKVEALGKQGESGDREQKTEISITKRFGTLYKNTVFSKKAIGGYSKLSNELKLKGEEVIHQLNEDAGKVKIKRKVFGKKNRATVFEVIFGYKGRLYFRRLKDSRVEVLSIGTKNTQRKDLEFLDKL
jgi:hypothetical protein